METKKILSTTLSKQKREPLTKEQILAITAKVKPGLKKQLEYVQQYNQNHFPSTI